MTKGCKNCKFCRLDKTFSRGLSAKSYLCYLKEKNPARVLPLSICKHYVKKDHTK